MSNTPNFFVQGKIDKDSDVYVVARTVVTGSTSNLSPNIFRNGTNVENSNVMWSVMGVKESYTPFDNVTHHSYYHYDGTNYYYPLKVFGDHNTAYNINITTGEITNSNTTGDYILYGDSDDITTIMSSSPPPDKTFLSSETLVNLPLVYKHTSLGLYSYPVYLNKGERDSSKTIALLAESGSYRLAFHPSVYNYQAGAPTEGSEIVFYNPYQSIMDNLFTLKQSLNSNQGINLTMSSAPRANSVKKYKNITVNDNGVLTPSRTGDSDFLTLSVEDVNIDTTNIYAGVGYKLTPTKNPTLQMKIKFVQGISKPTDTPLLHHAGIKYSDSTPDPHQFMAGDNPLNKNVTYRLSEFSGNTTFYFIPHHMYQVSTNMRLEYTGYTPIDMLTAYIYNVRPKILHGPLASENSVNYYKWATTAGFSTDKSELSFTTTSHDAHVGVVRRYCRTGEFCGDCYGICDPKNTAHIGKTCILDTESQTHDHPFTCDHDRHMDSSKYVSKGMIGNHSNSFIIIILIIAVIIGGGVLLFEERKMFLKYVVSSKNGHHQTR